VYQTLNLRLTHTFILKKEVLHSSEPSSPTLPIYNT